MLSNAFFFKIVKNWDCVVVKELTLYHTIPTSNYHNIEPFSHNIFYPSDNKFQIFSHVYPLLSAHAFNFNQFQILSFGKEVKDNINQEKQISMTSAQVCILCKSTYIRAILGANGLNPFPNKP